MARTRTWTNELLPELRAAVLELADPETSERAPDDVLRELAGRFPVVGRGLVELMARDPSTRVHEQSALLMYFAARFAPPKLRSSVLGTAAVDLLDAMRDPQVTDERKYALGPLLATLGHPLPDDEYAACFQDFEGTVDRLARDGMTSLLDVPEQVDALLGFNALIGPESEKLQEPQIIEALERAVDTILHNAQVGCVLATTIAAIAREKGIALEPAVAALEIVARTKTPHAAWYLSELASWPAQSGADEVREKARSLVEELSGERPQSVGTFSHGLVSAVDGEGSRDLVLFFHTTEGTLDGVALLLNERQGLGDVFASFGDGVELELQARERFASWAPCDVAFARDLVADALAVHEKTGRPVPGRFLLYRPYLGEQRIVPASRKPALGAYALETIVPGPALLEGADELLEHEVYGDLGSTSDEAYDFARKRKRSGKGTLDDFMKKVVLPERDVLLSRLGSALEIEARAGRAKQPENRIAARTYLAIESELVPFENVPYVRALSRRALQAIERNVKKGFKTQAEASAAVGVR